MIAKLKYQMVIQWSEEDDCFLVGFPDFPGQQWRTHGNYDVPHKLDKAIRESRCTIDQRKY